MCSPPISSDSTLLKRLAGGWQITGTGILQSGTPFTVFTDAPFTPILGPNGAVVGLAPNSGDYNADGVNFDFPNAPAGPPVQSSTGKTTSTACSGGPASPCPPRARRATWLRSSFRNPGFINIDMSLIKNNRITEHVNAQFRFEVFNVLNRVNLQRVNGNLASSTFGRSTSTYDPRIIQLGARVTF